MEEGTVSALSWRNEGLPTTHAARLQNGPVEDLFVFRVLEQRVAREDGLQN